MKSKGKRRWSAAARTRITAERIRDLQDAAAMDEIRLNDLRAERDSLILERDGARAELENANKAAAARIYQLQRERDALLKRRTELTLEIQRLRPLRQELDSALHWADALATRDKVDDERSGLLTAVALMDDVIHELRAEVAALKEARARDARHRTLADQRVGSALAERTAPYPTYSGDISGPLKAVGAEEKRPMSYYGERQTAVFNRIQADLEKAAKELQQKADADAAAWLGDCTASAKHVSVDTETAREPGALLKG